MNDGLILGYSGKLRSLGATSNCAHMSQWACQQGVLGEAGHEAACLRGGAIFLKAPDAACGTKGMDPETETVVRRPPGQMVLLLPPLRPQLLLRWPGKVAMGKV